MFFAAVIWSLVSVARRQCCAGRCLQVPRSSQNQCGGKTSAPRAEGKGWFAALVDPSLGCVNGAAAQALHQCGGAAGGEKELAEERTIAAFNGGATLKC